MGADDVETSTVDSVEKSLRVLEALWKLDGAGVTDLADYLDEPKSTIHIHLQTLHEHGFVISDSGTYTIGIRFLTFGGYAKRSHPLYEVARGPLEAVADETEENAFCFIEQHGLATVILTASGRRSVRTNVHVGTQAYMHASAAGKAILASLPAERTAEILDKWGLKQFTEHTITDRQQLLDELDKDRSENVFYGRQEYRKGITSIGVPISAEGEVLGAITVMGPSRRLVESIVESSLPNRLLVAANTIEVNLDTQ